MNEPDPEIVRQLRASNTDYENISGRTYDEPYLIPGMLILHGSEDCGQSITHLHYPIMCIKYDKS